MDSLNELIFTEFLRINEVLEEEITEEYYVIVFTNECRIERDYHKNVNRNRSARCFDKNEWSGT
jgi:hypothetical protein